MLRPEGQQNDGVGRHGRRRGFFDFPSTRLLDVTGGSFGKDSGISEYLLLAAREQPKLQRLSGDVVMKPLPTHSTLVGLKADVSITDLRTVIR